MQTRAQESTTGSSPYMLIHCENDVRYEVKLSDNFAIENKGKYLKVNGADSEIPEIEIASVLSLGIVYLNAEAGIDSMFGEENETLEVYDVNGILIKVTNSKNPDLKDLTPGKVYILKTKSQTIKYLPYK